MMSSGVSVYIVPRSSGSDEECKIVETDGFVKSCSASYLERPSIWREVGMMNSRGEVVCLTSQSDQTLKGLQESVPMVAGMEFFFE